jgi:glycosyltransferase involved in cell wall biosynthesis
VAIQIDLNSSKAVMKTGSGLPKLAYVVHSLNPGGAEKLAVQMSLAFAEDFDVSVVCLDEPGLWAKDLRANGIPVHCLWRQPGVDISIPIRLAKHFRQHRTKIVHAHQCTPWFYAALSRLLYPAPQLLLEEHGRFFPEEEKRRRALVNRFLIRRLTHRFVAVSEDIRKRLEIYEGLDTKQVEIIYNGVTTNPSLSPGEREALRHELGLDPDSYVVGTVGRLDSIKNLPMLVRSVAAAREKIGTLRGLVVGDGPVFAEIRSLIEQIGLCERIQLTGFRDDARKLIQCMDLFVLCSFSEGTSMALLEAIAAGIPVTVTDVGGNPEIVIKDTTGWIVPSNAVGALTDAIVESADNEQKRLRFAAAGKRRFKECFSFDRMIEAYRQRYEELLSIG